MIKIGVPNKGRLNLPSIELLQKSGLQFTCPQGQLSKRCKNIDVEIVFARATDIPLLTEKGILDLGITGLDLVCEQNIKIEKICELEFGLGDIVFAYPENFIWDKQKKIRVASSYPHLTKNFCESNNISFEWVPMDGAVELSPKLNIADAIVDLTSTGTTLKKNGLVISKKIMSTQACLFANNQSLITNRKMIEGIVMAIESVLCAGKNKIIQATIPKKYFQSLRNIIPEVNGMQVMSFSNQNTSCAIQAVISENDLFNITSQLQNLGASNIFILSLERMITSGVNKYE